MKLSQRVNRLEQRQPKTPKQGFFADNARLLISVVDGKGNDIYGILIAVNTSLVNVFIPILSVHFVAFSLC